MIGSVFPSNAGSAYFGLCKRKSIVADPPPALVDVARLTSLRVSLRISLGIPFTLAEYETAETTCERIILIARQPPTLGAVMALAASLQANWISGRSAAR